jgi:UDP:flavonoid glycosyltransferase YjiC (YdhE family)
MACILLGWELGAGTGHAVKLREIGRILAARGHDAIYAVQHVAAFGDGPVWQAPLWPSQLTTLARPATITPATMGDILVALGLTEPGLLPALIGAWDRILAAVRPDAIAAEFAPALMLAAAGRVPLVGLGSGFTLPPGAMATFPSLTGEAAAHDEAPLLDTVNRALTRFGRPPISALPAIFAADRELPAAFAELDPYRAARSDPAGLPSIAGEVPLADPAGDELFVYMNGSQTRPPAFWQGLHRSGLKVRVHDPRLNGADRSLLRGAGFAVEDAPISFAEIARRSRLVLSHCGLGFASSALLAGLPHILVPFDVEKRLIAAAVTGLGLGLTMPFEAMEAEPFADFLRAAATDDVLTARSRAAAPAFRTRMTGNSDEQAATLAAALATA